MEKAKQVFWIIVTLIAMAMGKVIGQHYFHAQTSHHREKTLGEMAINAPLPKSLINGMQPINVDENLYIEFDTYIDASSNEEYVLGDWRSYDDKNELRITFVQFNKDQVKDVATFATMTELQRQEFIKQTKTIYETGAKKMGFTVSFLEDGYFKVNDNVVIWLKGIIKINDAMSENAFYYYVAKNRKVYTLSYFTLDSLDNKPNDTILTSLNTLQLNKIQNNTTSSTIVKPSQKSEINEATKIEQPRINTEIKLPEYNLPKNTKSSIPQSSSRQYEEYKNSRSEVSTRPAPNQSLAENVLQEFHLNITNKLYRQAYDCLSEAFQKEVPFDGWVKGFNTTVSSTPYNITISPESNNENVVLTYELKAVDNPGGTTYYNGIATLINTPLGWKIDRIKNKLQ